MIHTVINHFAWSNRVILRSSHTSRNPWANITALWCILIGLHIDSASRGIVVMMPNSLGLVVALSWIILASLSVISEIEWRGPPHVGDNFYP